MKLNTLKISKYLNSDNKDFKIFKMNYTKDEINTIDQFNIENSKFYKYLGNRENLLDLNELLNSIGGLNKKSIIKKMENIIYKIIDNILKAYNTEYFSIDIRASLPTNLYDIPRWHFDGHYHNSNCILKFCTTLKGPGTLLIKRTKKVNEKFEKIDKKLEEEIFKSNDRSPESQYKITQLYRPIMHKALMKEKIIQTNNNEAVIINGKVTIHSEPKMDSNRLYIQIVPCSKEIIEGWKQKISKQS